MKVAVSLPDPLFATAEALRDRLGLARSQLYARALDLLIESYRFQDIESRLEAVYGSEPSKPDPGLVDLQAEALTEDW